MAEGEKIGGGYVTVGADLSSFDAAMAALPKKAAAKMDAAMRALKAKAAQAKLELRVAYNSGDLEAQKRLQPIYENLRGKIDAVTQATLRQAQAIQTTARAAQQAAAAHGAAQQRAQANAARVAATGQGLNSVWLDDQMASRLGKVGEAGKKAGKDVYQGGSNGAMGLMILSQTIDDARFGLSAVVNNMPQVGMAIGQALGVSTEKAMAFGGAMGIAAVAVNTWVNQADHVKAIFGGSQSEDVKELADQLTSLTDTARSLFATLVNLDGGFNWVSTAGKDVDALTKQMDDKAKFAAEAAKRTTANRGTVSGIKAAGSDERGAGFGKAVEAFGGGDKLAETLVQKRMSQIPADTAEFDPWGGGTRDEFDKAKAERAATREQNVRNKVDADIAAARGGDRDAIARLASEDARLKGAVATNAPGAKEARDKAAAENKTAVGRTAGALSDTVGREALANPDMSMPELWGLIKEAMEEAGFSVKEIVDQLPSVAMKIKADTAAKVKEKAASEGVGVGEAREMLLKEAAERDKQKADNTPEAREAERLARSMEGGVGQRYLEGKTTDEDNLKREVGESMKKAGMSADEIGKLVDGTASRLKENLDKAVQERAVQQNISVGAAQAQLAKEGQERNERGTDKPKAEVMSTESYLSKVLVGALNQEKDGRVPQDQLAEAKASNKVLKEIHAELKKGQKPGPAMVARGGA